ncbi:MAG: hypothetical protein NTU43_07720 [Bacteroidetes bacterium]|nr:hypothetical protein [Bacteroidota bacterium]
MKKVLLIAIILACLVACDTRTYFETNVKSYSALVKGDYKTSLNEIENNKYLKAAYNKQLYLMEKGRLLQIIGDNEQAAKLLNEADELSDSWSNAKVRTANGFINISHKTPNNYFSGQNTIETNLPSQLFTSSRKKTYRSEHYERMMLNYTKAISYINMSKRDEALVEGKRLLLFSEQLDVLKQVETNYIEYVSDPFPQLFAGILYEWDGDYSNAFISFENAYNIYLKKGVMNVYGLAIPQQLKIDILALAYKLGFNDKLEYYQNLFGVKYTAPTNHSELLLFIEDGYIASRNEEVKYYLFDTIRGYAIDNTDRGFGGRLYLPSYLNHYTERNISITANKQAMGFTTIRNNQYVVMNTLYSRVQKERANMITTYLKSVTAKNNGNTAAHVDTRNWQSISAKVAYVRIPLLYDSNNEIVITAGNKQYTLNIVGTSGLQIKHIRVDNFN